MSKKIKPYCLRCQTTYDKNFYISLNKYHTSGYLPYCKRCIGEIHEELYNKYDKNLEVSIYFMCRMLDTPYRLSTLELAIRQIEREIDKEKTPIPMSEAYKYYFSFLNNALKGVEDVNFDYSDVCLDAIKITIMTKNINLDEKIAEWVKDEETERKKMFEELRTLFGDYERKYSEAELLLMKKEYDKLIDGLKIKTDVQENFVILAVKTKMVIDGKISSGLDCKKEADMYKMFIEEAKKVPKIEGVSDIKTIGMAIKEIENRRPAEDIELRKKYFDLDGFNDLYIHFVGGIAKAQGIEDSTTALLDQKVAQYKLTNEELRGIGVIDEE